MTGCLLNLPVDYELHLNHHSARLIHHRQVIFEEFFIRPELQYDAITRIKDKFEAMQKQQRNSQHQMFKHHESDYDPDSLPPAF